MRHTFICAPSASLPTPNSLYSQWIMPGMSKLTELTDGSSSVMTSRMGCSAADLFFMDGSRRKTAKHAFLMRTA